MFKFDLESYQEQLLRMQAELERNMHQRDGLVIEKSSDLSDEVRSAADRELVMRSRDLESVLLREVRSALGRVRNGSFGICLECSEPISSRRLNAVPWAPYCLPCQEAADQQTGTGERVGPDEDESFSAGRLDRVSGSAAGGFSRETQPRYPPTLSL